VLDEPVDELARERRVQQHVERPGGSVGVPEPVVDVDLPVDQLVAGRCRRVVAHLVDDGTGVPPDRLVRGPDVLVRGVRVEVEPVEVRVDGRARLGVGQLPVDRDDRQPLVPGELGQRDDVVEAEVVELQLEVRPCLLVADERGGEPERDLGGVVGELGEARDIHAPAIGERAGSHDGRVERSVDEHPAGAFGAGAGEDVGEAGDDTVGADAETAVVGHVVEDDPTRPGGGVVGEREPEDRGMVGRRDLGDDAGVGVDGVVMRPGGLGLVVEGQGARQRVGGPPRRRPGASPGTSAGPPSTGSARG